ncbi:hypothetical protein GCM10009539_36910 [Cryptosporangium japonicum]|uniref:Uncharacterized protein n=1 Tax=Cryptosporangium japonicum TaxID=80872 RepID=A0ABN0UEV0_9ACTN
MCSGSRGRLSIEQWSGLTAVEAAAHQDRSGLRDHEILGREARHVLRYADSAVTGPVLDAARAARRVRLSARDRSREFSSHTCAPERLQPHHRAHRTRLAGQQA